MKVSRQPRESHARAEARAKRAAKKARVPVKGAKRLLPPAKAPPKAKLTPRQERFVEEYLLDMNATQAAIRAGFKPKYARQYGALLTTKNVIASAIATARQKVSLELQCTADDIARELHKLGFSNMGDYMRAGRDGEPYLDFSKLSRDQTAALSEVTVEDYVDGRGEDARDVKRLKFRLWDKRAALVDLSKQLGLAKPDKIEHSGSVAVGLTPEQIKRLSDEDLAAAYAAGLIIAGVMERAKNKEKTQ